MMREYNYKPSKIWCNIYNISCKYYAGKCMECPTEMYIINKANSQKESEG